MASGGRPCRTRISTRRPPRVEPRVDDVRREPRQGGGHELFGRGDWRDHPRGRRCRDLPTARVAATEHQSLQAASGPRGDRAVPGDRLPELTPDRAGRRGGRRADGTWMRRGGVRTLGWWIISAGGHVVAALGVPFLFGEHGSLSSGPERSTLLLYLAVTLGTQSVILHQWMQSAHIVKGSTSGIGDHPGSTPRHP